MTDWNNKEQVIKAVSESGYELHNASAELRADREVVMAAVQKSGWALEYASDELRADKEIVLAAVKNNGTSLIHTSAELRQDREVISASVNSLLNMIEKYNSLYPEGDENRIEYGPVDTSKIENFEDYPYDYQCFMKRIGWLGYGPGTASLSVNDPAALKDIYPNESGEYEPDGYFLEIEMNLRYDNEGETIADWAKKENIADHILVAEDPCSLSYLAFNPNTTPYTPIDIMEPTWSGSFLDYVEYQLYHPLEELSAHEEKLAAELKESTKQSREKSPTDALRNIHRSKTAIDDHTYWFEEYSKSDFTKFTIIEAHISWAYWAAEKYGLLAERKDTSIAESFIQEHKKSIEERMGIAHESLSNWSDIPPIMKSILVQIFDSTGLSINSTLDFSDSVIFHKKLGLEKEEPITESLDKIDREQALIRTYNQFTDDLNLFSLYYKWVHACYGLIQEMYNIKDVKAWELFAKNCRINLKSKIPTKSTIGNAAIATVMHLEIQPYSKLKLADEYARQWSNLFRSASEMNEALLELTKSGEFPNDQSFPIFEEKMDKASISQHDASLAIAELIFNKSNLTE